MFHSWKSANFYVSQITPFCTSAKNYQTWKGNFSFRMILMLYQIQQLFKKWPHSKNVDFAAWSIMTKMGLLLDLGHICKYAITPIFSIIFFRPRTCLSAVLEVDKLLLFFSIFHQFVISVIFVLLSILSFFSFFVIFFSFYFLWFFFCVIFCDIFCDIVLCDFSCDFFTFVSR